MSDRNTTAPLNLAEFREATPNKYISLYTHARRPHTVCTERESPRIWGANRSSLHRLDALRLRQGTHRRTPPPLLALESEGRRTQSQPKPVTSNPHHILSLQPPQIHDEWPLSGRIPPNSGPRVLLGMFQYEFKREKHGVSIELVTQESRSRSDLLFLSRTYERKALNLSRSTDLAEHALADCGTTLRQIWRWHPD